MKKKLLYAILIATLAAGCAHQQKSKDYVDDQTTSARIKSDLLRDTVINGQEIYVSTYQGRVELTGYVANQQQKQRAETIAASEPGVLAVHNDLIVRTGR
jgi:hyperosmotically inducible periplasmic protein